MPPARKKRACNAQVKKENTNQKSNNGKENLKGRKAVSKSV